VDTEATLRVGKRIRITAANIVNVNVTSAGLESLVEAVLSWGKQMELEQQARMSLEMVCTPYLSERLFVSSRKSTLFTL
jgi:vacuolar protein sorting-associated protein 13A/C